MENRIQWIDSIKGLGILLIMFSHSCTIPVFGYYLFYGYIPLFFLSSGFTSKRLPTNEIDAATKIRHIIKLTLNDAKRLLYPYIFYGFTLSFLTWYLFHESFQHSLYSILYSRAYMYKYLMCGENKISLLSGYGTAPLWFLTCMFVGKLWFNIYRTVCVNKSKMFFVMLLTFLSMVFYNTRYLLPWSFDTSFLASMFMIIGYEYRQYTSKIKYNPLFIIAIFIVFLAISTFNGDVNFSISMFGKHGILSILIYIISAIAYTLLFSIILIKFEKTKISKLLSVIGRYSLRLLCLHLFLFELIKYYYDSIILDYSLPFIISFMVVLASELLDKRFNVKYI